MSKVLGHADVVAETRDPAALTGLRDVVQGAVSVMIELQQRVLGNLIAIVDHAHDHIPDLPSLARVSTCTPFPTRNPGAKR